MRLFAVIALFLFTLTSFGQTAEKVLATSNGKKYTAETLSPRGRQIYENSGKLLADVRARLFGEYVGAVLLEAEAKATGGSADAVLAAARSKVARPSDAQIRALYDANIASMNGRPLESVRADIAAHLQNEAQEKALDTLMTTLRSKHKVTIVRDINAPGLKPADVLATIGSKSITLQEFETVNRIDLSDAEAEIYEEIRADLSASILSVLVAAEAASRNIGSGELIAAEITDKMRSFTEEEREKLESALKKRLFEKHAVRIQLKEPEFIRHTIATDGDPSFGPAAAPVMVVMFTDFQCPACAATHPVLKAVLAEYGEKVRLVVRDFPLESIHDNAFQAALAANAANEQGKFLEFAERLYANQASLNKTSLEKHAAETGLNVKQFTLDFSDAKAAAEVRADVADGRKLGISGTPSVFVNGIKVQRISADGFRDAIERALQK